MLNLPQLTQTKLIEGPEQYEVFVTADTPAILCDCLLPNIVKNGTKSVMFMDTPIHGKKVGIWVARQRYLCRGCKSTHYATVPHMSEKHEMTERLVAYIQKTGTERTFTAVASEIGVDPQTVRGIWQTHAKGQLSKLAPVTPEWLGIDELFIMGGYRAIITNVKQNTLVDMLPNRKKATLISYFAGMPEKEKIVIVTLDMNQDYKPSHDCRGDQ